MTRILVVTLAALILLGGCLIPSADARKGETLMTRWGAQVTADNVHPEYPRPQLVREEWLTLNGLWEYAVTTGVTAQPAEYRGEILVPFPIESALSGVQRKMGAFDRLWYRRTVELPAEWAGQRILLRFGAVDWEAVIRVNGVELGPHRGGYDPFAVDITDALRPAGPQEIVVVVWDPTSLGTQPRGKQVLNPEAIWYTATTGIWQTVWLEPVPAAAHIESLRLTPDIDADVLRLTADVPGAGPGDILLAEALQDGAVVGAASGPAGEALDVPVPDPILWSPDTPFLYDLRVTLQRGDEPLDTVTSYFGMRHIAVRAGSDGVPRLYLNHEPLFNFGLLDQGFWPDGLYTAPSDEALRYDIEVTRQLGFNTIRKHVKVEPERWYYWADRLGVLVWQDMPSGDAMVGWGEGEITRETASAAQFEHELARLVDTHYNHPSVIMWVIFNEGWGQYDTVRLAEWLADYDPSRLVNSASGWNDMGAGDLYDIHSYPGPDAPPVSTARAAVLGEFGGLGLPVVGHLWQEDENWGYRGYESVEALTAAYASLIDRLGDLVRSRGLAAAIYTQTTDVEIEVNGMLTYDREVIKMDVDQIYALNTALYGLLPE